MDDKIYTLCKNFEVEFERSITVDARYKRIPNVLRISSVITQYNIDYTIFNDDESIILTIPVPFIRNNVQLLKIGNVERPTCTYYKRKEDKYLNYLELMNEVLIDDLTGEFATKFCRGHLNSIKHIKRTNEKGNFQSGVNTVQRIIDKVVRLLPIHTTDMNSWVKNQRISIIDKDFDDIKSPAEKHEYQVAKNREFYNRGWSSLGLADGSLSSDNYMLSVDLRTLAPFGLNHHNPQRNLYSTLNMRGDETPLVMSKTMAKLKAKGLHRTGWNLFTVFVDIPDVYEDQLMLDISHADKYIDYDKKICIYDDILVDKNDTIYQHDPIGVSGDKLVRLKIPCDSAFVEDITKEDKLIGGESVKVYILHLKCRRFLKDGAKLTNLAANKGVVRLADLGYAIDPSSGKERKIDIIVSSRAVLKRQNYTQVIEAILNNVNNENEIVLNDDVETSEELLSKALVQAGYKADGTWECKTYVGDFNCVCGTVFWGVTHDADDTTWEGYKTFAEDMYGTRKAGLKFSTIEFSALKTRFGKNNPLEKEILSYSQGGDEIEELLRIADSKCNIYNEAVKIISYSDISPITERGNFFEEELVAGTILDENLYQEGFMLKLPVKYQISVDKDNFTLAEGFPCDYVGTINDKEVAKQIVIDKIYIPCYNIRQYWKHQIGKCSHNELGSIINEILISCQRYDDENMETISDIYRDIFRYYKVTAKMLGGKRGKISILGMSVRYPKSAKAVATLSNDLPENTVEIYKNMADNLGISTGDVVLVERFPCLGFMSLRPQYVRVTNDINCRYTIRASGNSLGSTTLDFDGDVLYIAAFDTEEAKEMLHKEMIKPNELCNQYITEFNATMGIPRFKEMSLAEYKVTKFKPLTKEDHSEIIEKLSGVKNYTGPVVALAYNLLRIAETSDFAQDQKFNCELEVFMNTVANSVFKQKHGVASLHQIVTDAVCMADVKTLEKEGFSKNISEILCNIITTKAKSLGITNLEEHHKEHLEGGKSTIINVIVRNENKLYFASRSRLDLTIVRQIVRNFDKVDLPSEMFSKILKHRNSLEKDAKLDSIVEAAGNLIHLMLPDIKEEKEKYFKLETG